MLKFVAVFFFNSVIFIYENGNILGTGRHLGPHTVQFSVS